MPDNETILHEWFDQVWNQKDTALIDELMTDETKHHGLAGPDGGAITGLDNFKGFHQAFLNAFPDLHVEVNDVVMEGDKIAARCTVTGTHLGDGLGFAPTGKKVRFTGGGICHMKDGKFTEIWNEYDFMKMHADLGTLVLNLG